MTLYNPHLLARQDLIETFVARQPLLDELLDDLRRGAGQHHLLVGNRGSGKTTLLLRLAAAIEDDKKLARKCIPLRFPEEQYNVSRPSDFWMNAIDALVDALERQGDGVAAKRLEASLSELEPLDEDERARQSLAALERWAKQARRLIVLLVDNLDLVLDRLAASLWDLREALSIDNRLVVVGASSKFIEEAIDYQSPFYDFFHVHELAPLSEEDARSIVLSLARRANTPRVAEVLERDPGRFKALYVLTGGTPRTLALLHTVLALDDSDRIERDLDGMLDQLTPYYKARFDDLPAQSQVIIDKVALHWHPITAAECQEATHLDLNTVSAQLSRLVKSGLLSKVSLPGAHKLGFQLSERFFNIWYLMRASRRLRRRLSWLVEFLRILYGEEDLQRRAEELVRAAPSDSLNSPAKFLAFASAVPDEALRRRLEFRAIGLLLDQDRTVIRELMDFAGEDRHLIPILDRARALREIRAQIINSKVRLSSGLSSTSVAEAVAGHPFFSLRSKQTMTIAACNDINFNIPQFSEIIMEVFELASGRSLLDAIASGELPSVFDITVTNMRSFIESANNQSLISLEILISNEYLGTPFTDDMIRELIRSSQAAPSGLVAIANKQIRDGNWVRARQLLVPLLQSPGISAQLETFMTFFSCCVNENRASEAADLLGEADLAERWAPIYEALRAIADGNRSRLDALAPEMRAPALHMFNVLTSVKEEKKKEQEQEQPQPNEASTQGNAPAPGAPSLRRRKPTNRGAAKQHRPLKRSGLKIPG